MSQSLNSQPIIPILDCKKVLYMSHLALGDYIYQGAFLKSLVGRYPNLVLDVWIDDCRSIKKPWHTGRSNTLVQWLSSEPHINYVYPIVNDGTALSSQLKHAHDKDYDAILYVATSRTANFAKTALKIKNQGQVFGTLAPTKLNNFLNHCIYKHLDGALSIQQLEDFNHITDYYHHIFCRFFDALEPERRELKLNLSDHFQRQCVHKLTGWKNKYNLVNPTIIFINHLATDRRRSWSRSKLKELIQSASKKRPNTLFILNSPPHDFQSMKEWIMNNDDINSLPVELFTAKTDFFELPGLMSLCDLVISVETAIMHIASSLNIKQIALIRQSRSAYCWRPLNNSIILEGNKRHVETVQPIDVLDAIETSFKSMDHQDTVTDS